MKGSPVKTWQLFLVKLNFRGLELENKEDWNDGFGAKSAHSQNMSAKKC